MDYRGPWGSGSSGIEANFIFLQNNPQLGTKGFSVDLKMSIIGPDRNIDYWTLSSNVGRSTGGIDIYELKDDKNGKLVLKFRTIENWIPKIDNPDFRKYKINSGGEGIVEIQ